MTAMPAPAPRPVCSLRGVPDGTSPSSRTASGSVRGDAVQPTGSGVARPLAVDRRGALQLARMPWSLPTGSGKLRVRGAVPADLPAVARMHGRCSGETLLQRYQRGGLPPALPALDELLRTPLVVVVQTPSGEIVAMASGGRPAVAPGRAPEPSWTMQLGLVVEDGWQDLGIGRRLAAHVAASAQLLGSRELVADVVAQGLPLRRVLDSVGPTRSTHHRAGWRLRTRLDVSVLGGLGTVKGVLAG
jgi:GNAT superfamily N-acetyltransferase